MLAERGGVQSSPVTATMAKDERRPGSVAAGKGMGVKQIEEVHYYYSILMLFYSHGHG